MLEELLAYYLRIKVPRKTLKGKTLIRDVKGGDKLENFHTQKSVEIELAPHQDLNYFRDKPLLSKITKVKYCTERKMSRQSSTCDS